MKPVLYFITLIAFMITGCDSCKTTPNKNDNTPPAITWTIQNRTQSTQTNLTGNASYNAKYGDDLLITACAEDDGGLQELVNYSNSSYTCRAGDIAQQTGPGLVVPTTTTLGLDKNGKAWKKFCVFMNMNLTFGCSSGFSFSSGSAGANLKATNYAGLSASGTLSISVSK
ncbi:MAG TPA: hypothetical protein VFN30_10545 [Chitinophagaceae bacterium]|nr:hypothetical protein [Chitinophagaceae bacterium]